MLVQARQLPEQVVADVTLVFAVMRVVGKFCRLVVNSAFLFEELIGDEAVWVSSPNFLVHCISVQRCTRATTTLEMMSDATGSSITCPAEWAYDPFALVKRNSTSAVLIVGNGTSLVLILGDVLRLFVLTRLHMLARSVTQA